MALYALIYRYIDDPDTVSLHRPEHRAYLSSLSQCGELLAAGPLGDPGPAGGLLVLDVESVDRVKQITENDPFYTRGVVTERTVQEWTLSIGADRFPEQRSTPYQPGLRLAEGTQAGQPGEPKPRR